MIGEREGTKNFCFEFAMAMKIEDKLAVKIKIKNDGTYKIGMYGEINFQ